MLIGSWAFTGQVRETEREGQSQREDEQRKFPVKKIILKVGLKLCETTFSGGYIHLAHLLTSKNRM